MQMQVGWWSTGLHDTSRSTRSSSAEHRGCSPHSYTVVGFRPYLYRLDHSWAFTYSENLFTARWLALTFPIFPQHLIVSVICTISTQGSIGSLLNSTGSVSEFTCPSKSRVTLSKPSVTTAQLIRVLCTTNRLLVTLSQMRTNLMHALLKVQSNMKWVAEVVLLSLAHLKVNAIRYSLTSCVFH